MNSPDERRNDRGEPQNGSPFSRPEGSEEPAGDSPLPPHPAGPTDRRGEDQPGQDSHDGAEPPPNLPTPPEPKDGLEDEDAEEHEQAEISENTSLQRIVEGLPLPSEKKAELFAVIRQETSSHRGWLPTPDFMRQYDEVLPGLAERIVRMPEREQAHRHGMIDQIITRDYQLRSTGQYLGIAALALILLFCCFLVIHGDTTAAAGVAIGVIAAVVGVFVTGQLSGSSSSSKDLIEDGE